MCLFNTMQIIANYSIPLLNIHVYIKHIYIEFYNDYGERLKRKRISMCASLARFRWTLEENAGTQKLKAYQM